MSFGRMVRGGSVEEVDAIRFLESTGKALSVVKRDVEGHLRSIGESDRGVYRAMSDAVKGIGEAMRDVAVAMGAVRSRITERETAFVSSDRQAAQELIMVAEELE